MRENLGSDKAGLRRLVLGTVAAGAVVAMVLAFLSAQRSDSAGNTGPGTVRAPAAVAGFEFSAHDRPRPLPATLRFVRGDGQAMTLGDLRGRAILLNVWATWCAPCRDEMPALDRLQAALGNEGFEVVALSIDRQGVSAVEPFYRQLGLRSLGIYVDPTGGAGRELGAVGIPTTLLIDREGMEVARKVGPAEWDSPGIAGAIRKHLGLREFPGEPASASGRER